MPLTSLKYQFELIQAIRNFFLQQGFTDVMVPPMVQNPGIEPHIHPFRIHSTHREMSTHHYLHTSPEFAMKWLLSNGFEKIFTITYSFRDEPVSPIHRPQFLMLEWYRAEAHYLDVLKDTQDLIEWSLQSLEKCSAPLKFRPGHLRFEKRTVQELFLEEIKIDILQFLEITELKSLIEKSFPDVPLPKPGTGQSLGWDDYFFLLFLNKIEPSLKKRPLLFLYEYPAPLAALSTLKSRDARVCERFELYIDGVEICNCFNELTDLNEQKLRFKKSMAEKQRLYSYKLPEPTVLFSALEKGLPRSSGNALGIERLLSSLVKLEGPLNSPFFDLDKSH